MNLTKRTAIAVTLSAWIAVGGSAAALIYGLKRPPHIPAVAVVSEAPPAGLVQQPASPPPTTLEIPTITIVGHFHRPTAHPPKAEPAPQPKAEPTPESVEVPDPTRSAGD